jgi:hypothetical protein
MTMKRLLINSTTMFVLALSMAPAQAQNYIARPDRNGRLDPVDAQWELLFRTARESPLRVDVSPQGDRDQEEAIFQKWDKKWQARWQGREWHQYDAPYGPALSPFWREFTSPRQPAANRQGLGTIIGPTKER